MTAPIGSAKPGSGRCLSDYPARAALYDAKQRLNELLLLKNLRKKTAQEPSPSAVPPPPLSTESPIGSSSLTGDTGVH